jgi:ATP-dependent exoDNAse (exonuclease V) alpha subunit
MAEAHLAIIDEVSMVNEEMANDLMSFDVPILVVGDPGQLPPIEGAGYFTNREPDIFLREIHRQAADNPIIRLARWRARARTSDRPIRRQRGCPLRRFQGDPMTTTS